MMTTALTQNIKVSVSTKYQTIYSNPLEGHYVFSYKISIENQSDYAVQLLHRHWYIHDADGTRREVVGEGVIGEQPIIEAGGRYEYSSGCNLRSGMGKMYGYYTMQRLADEQEIAVEIPAFTMFYPPFLN
jgi:ApaG protein